MGNRLQRIRTNKGLDAPFVNLTPLIDVVFCILITFIVIAPLLELDEVSLAGAGKGLGRETAAVKEEGPIAIHVRQDNTVLLNKRIVELALLPKLLKQERVRHPETRPQVYHDKRAQFGTYQSIKNAAENAGFEEIDVILKPD